jgi:hypothetical protein
MEMRETPVKMIRSPKPQLQEVRVRRKAVKRGPK